MIPKLALNLYTCSWAPPTNFLTPHRRLLRAEADTEDDARAKFPRWTLIFAAQIRTEAPCRLQIFSTDEGFMWVLRAAPDCVGGRSCITFPLKF
nr:host cell division inhibitor Icd-like protein [Serratia odorifera]